MIRNYKIEEITQDKGYLFLMCAYSNTDDIHVLNQAFNVIFLKLSLNHPFPEDCGSVPDMEGTASDFIRTAGLPSLFERIRDLPDPGDSQGKVVINPEIDDILNEVIEAL